MCQNSRITSYKSKLIQNKPIIQKKESNSTRQKPIHRKRSYIHHKIRNNHKSKKSEHINDKKSQPHVYINQSFPAHKKHKHHQETTIHFKTTKERPHGPTSHIIVQSAILFIKRQNALKTKAYGTNYIILMIDIQSSKSLS